VSGLASGRCAASGVAAGNIRRIDIFGRGSSAAISSAAALCLAQRTLASPWRNRRASRGGNHLREPRSCTVGSKVDRALPCIQQLRQCLAGFGTQVCAASCAVPT
jgi:hypothetical protein